MTTKDQKSYRQLERIVRGFANHRRIQILELLIKEPELSIDQIAQNLRVNFKTLSSHVNRLAVAGLLLKRSQANAVRTRLTERGKAILKFLRTLE